MKKKYYIEMQHCNGTYNYDLQSKWFSAKKQALNWLKNNFDYISPDMIILLGTATWYDEDLYEIDDLTEIKL